jgi:hypothetical protein
VQLGKPPQYFLILMIAVVALLPIYCFKTSNLARRAAAEPIRLPVPPENKPAA